MRENPLISIGIITFNNSISEIKRCLDSIYGQTYNIEQIEIIIRNQGRSRVLQEIEALIQQNNWQNIKAYQGENIGFGKGHNELFSRISPQSKAYICFNPDGFWHDEALDRLIAMAYINDWNGIFESIQEPIMHPKVFDAHTGVTAWCSGACLLIPTTIYKIINGYDEDFFLYCEDVDLSWRVKASGFNCYTCSESYFFHYAMERQSREQEIWKAASYLAHKWRSDKFKKIALQQWSKYYDVPESDLKKDIAALQQHSFEEVKRANPDFHHGLVFSQQMWS